MFVAGLDATSRGVHHRWVIRRLMIRVPLLCLLLFSSLGFRQVHALFDHELPLDQNGIWGRQYQTGLENGVITVEVAGSLWFGNDNQLGHTFWQTIDASTLAGIGASVIKKCFQPFASLSR